MEWSREQEEIFNIVKNDSYSVMVKACPGSGKTTTLQEIWNRIGIDVIYLAFNRSNVIGAKKRMREQVNSEILTLNSLGHRMLTQRYRNIHVNAYKVSQLIRKLKLERKKESLLFQAVKKAKLLSMRVIDEENYREIISTYALEAYEEMLADINKILQMNDKMVHEIDFDDQLRLPVLNDLKYDGEFETILIDEVQDLNGLQMQMAERLEGRIIAVGDPHQAIYGFRGAVYNVMANMAERWDAWQLPLTTSYRCAKAISAEARTLYPDIYSADHLPEGSVESLSFNDFLKACQKMDRKEREACMVLCRLNAPLFGLSTQLKERNISYWIQGNDIKGTLISFIKASRAKDAKAFERYLEEWYQISLLKADEIGSVGYTEQIEERMQMLSIAVRECQGSDSLQTLLSHIEKTFGTEREGLCLSTIHKAKGQEAQVIYLLSGYDFEFGNEEKNVQYVGITRARERLVYVRS